MEQTRRLSNFVAIDIVNEDVLRTGTLILLSLHHTGIDVFTCGYRIQYRHEVILQKQLVHTATIAIR